MIPPFSPPGPGAVWRTLPPGIHDATLGDVAARFGTTPHRRALTLGLVRAAQALRTAGVGHLYVDGSYTTDKLHPGDFDGCWDPTSLDYSKLDPVLANFTLLGRAAQKAKYGGELFLSSATADKIGTTYLDYFQRDKDTGLPKGIIRITL
jgi:hypothetical protein